MNNVIIRDSRFSLLISVYHKEKPEYFHQCLSSIAGQTIKANETVIVEDGPVDARIKAIIEKYRSELNIISVCLPENSGLSNALNEGLNHCSYELIARMDSDDISLSNRFEMQLKYMEAHPELVAISSFVEEFDDNGQVTFTKTLPEDSESLEEFAKGRNPLSHPAVFFRRKPVLAVGGYPNCYPEDHFLWVKLLINGYKIGNVPKVLLRMRAGNEFFERRGLKFLKGEVRLLVFMMNERFITFPQFCILCFGRMVLRGCPKFLRVLAYKYLRNSA